MPVKHQQQQQQQHFLVKEEDIDYFFLPNNGSVFQGIQTKYPKFSIEEATNTRKFVHWLVYKKPQVEDVQRIIDVIHRFSFSGYNLPNLTEHLNQEILLHSHSFTYDWFIPVVERLLVAGATPNDLTINNQKHVIWPTLIDKWDTKQNHQQSLEMLRLFLKYGLDLNQPLDGKTAVDYAISIGKYQIAAILTGFFGGKTTETIDDILPDVRYLFTPGTES